MPDSASDQDPILTPLKNPHRPAPPVPAALLKPQNTDECIENTEDIEVIDDDNSSDYNGPTNNKRRKVKHPLSRRTLRQRKIHSLKRQIHIKEKMLEVS